MYPNKFENLEALKKYLVDSIQYDAKYGFSFNEIKLQTDFHDVLAILGDSGVINIESDQQQTLQYNALIDHPIEGTRNHNRLNLLFWAFNREPFKIIKLHFNYFNYGIYRETLREFIHTFFDEIINKFGKPTKKTLRNLKEKLLYEINGHSLSIWRNSEGVRIVLK